MRQGWITRKLGEVTTKIGSGATPLGGEGAYKAEGLSLIRSLNVHDDGFREAKLARIDAKQADRLSNVVVEPNDVLLNITGASVARCCVVPNQHLPARVNQHVSIIRPVKQILLPKFLHYMLISRDYKNRLLALGEDGGSTRQAITKAQIQEFEIEFPPSPNSSGLSACWTKRLRALPPPKPTPKRTSKTPAPSSKATSNPSSPSAARGGRTNLSRN